MAKKVVRKPARRKAAVYTKAKPAPTLKNSKGTKTKLVATTKSIIKNTVSKSADRKIKALPAGKRISKTTGGVYYERRSNRSDK